MSILLTQHWFGILTARTILPVTEFSIVRMAKAMITKSRPGKGVRQRVLFITSMTILLIILLQELLTPWGQRAAIPMRRAINSTNSLRELRELLKLAR